MATTHWLETVYAHHVDSVVPYDVPEHSFVSCGSNQLTVESTIDPNAVTCRRCLRCIERAIRNGRLVRGGNGAVR